MPVTTLRCPGLLNRRRPQAAARSHSPAGKRRYFANIALPRVNDAYRSDRPGRTTISSSHAQMGSQRTLGISPAGGAISVAVLVWPACGSTISATRARRSPWRVVSIRRSSRSASDTRPSASPSTRTHMFCLRCKKRRRPGSRRRCRCSTGGFDPSRRNPGLDPRERSLAGAMRRAVRGARPADEQGVALRFAVRQGRH